MSQHVHYIFNKQCINTNDVTAVESITCSQTNLCCSWLVSSDYQPAALSGGQPAALLKSGGFLPPGSHIHPHPHCNKVKPPTGGGFPLLHFQGGMKGADKMWGCVVTPKISAKSNIWPGIFSEPNL